jgi:hypothetical protein
MPKQLNYKVFLLAFFVIAFNWYQCFAQIHKWDVYTVTFNSSTLRSNPYNDIQPEPGTFLVQAVFQGTSGEALGKTYKINGYWNGGTEWRVNFAPPFAGSWKYTTSSPDKSLNKKSGSFDVIEYTESEKNANPVRRGFVQVRKSGETAGHYFEYADGTPFLWVGDTWWNWTNSKIKPETFMQMVDNRAEKGFNVGQLFVAANGWGRESSLLDETFTVLDTEHMKRVEEMIKYANSKGITVWIHGWWSRENLNTTAGAEKVKRYWRYLVDRFAAYNVIWVVAGEYNMYNNGGFSLEFWKELGALIKSEDPYQRIISLHNTPPFWDGGAAAPQWSTGSVLHSEPWLDYNQSQVGHGKYANEMIPYIISEEYNRKPAKPIVITEPWYEFIEGNPTGMDVRFAMWSAILSGAAGHTYGGGHVWLASVPEAPGGAGPWPIEKGFDRTTYDYEGAVSMKHMASFFKNIKWWDMSPHPELVREYPQPFCLAKPGEAYVLYLRYGGVVKLAMDELAAARRYKYHWINPGTGKISDLRSFQGNSIVQFNCPESYPGTPDYKDWVLYIYKE